jgi:formylmethanofuran dehydrogenase subunit E
MKSLEEYLALAGRHGLPRSGIILGIRMALLGLHELGVEDVRKAHDELVIFVETDRCLPDAMELVTGCRLGNRRLKLKDMGKMAATLLEVPTWRAVRVSAREAANQRALEMFPEADKDAALGKAYCLLSDDELFSKRFVRVALTPEDLPEFRSSRALCAQCGESIAFAKQVTQGDRTLCRCCAGESYFEVL